MTNDQTSPTTPTWRSDYAPPPYLIPRVELEFDLELALTRVRSRLWIERVPTAAPHEPLCLQGEDLNLLRIRVDEQPARYRLEPGQLVIDGDDLPGQQAFCVEIETTCAPESNTALLGLYASANGLFTQCEAEGFRRISYFLDRPDVMSVYTVTLRADKARFPVLLSNGNLVRMHELGDGRHVAVWHDPHPKPSYLFALVAADLAVREQRLRSNRGEHLIQVYARADDLHKTEHTMNVLEASILWDSTRWGLDLDLERFMVVAVSDFTAGAMENKGLNIFNTKFVLASPQTATDDDFAGIESVVSHEYFHNWTGNRITCRDWFQLALKEGLTVYREQEFLADRALSPTARAVRRIQDVRTLRAVQFPEDAGTMAHPVRPESYVRISNFYTPTVYKKGAEVVRMMETLVGRAGLRRGMDLYFQRHDGQAVTCDDFAQAIADANPQSPLALHLQAFMRWYSQAGTPRVRARGRYDAAASSFTLQLEQSVGAAEVGATTAAMVIPVRVALVGADGQPIPLRLEGEAPCADTQRVVVLTETQQVLRFVDVPNEPVPSLLRGFSAPVALDDGLDEPSLLHLLRHDDDPVNRWEAGQRLALVRLLQVIDGDWNDFGSVPSLDDAFIEAMRRILRDPGLDAAFKELVLTLPAEALVAEQARQVDPWRIHLARERFRRDMARRLRDDWLWAWEAHQVRETYRPDGDQPGRRALAHLALRHLVLQEQGDGTDHWSQVAFAQAGRATNMTDRFGALEALVEAGAALSVPALEQFHATFGGDPLVVDKWFALQARSPEPVEVREGADGPGRVLEHVQALLGHRDFTMKNPNRLRSLVGTYCLGNPAAFHLRGGAGYDFYVRQVREIDRRNPALASRMARSLDRWQVLAPPWRDHAHAALTRLSATDGLSADVSEVLARALRQG